MKNKEILNIIELLESDDFESRLLAITLLNGSFIRNNYVTIMTQAYPIYEFCELILKEPISHLKLMEAYPWQIQAVDRFEFFSTECLYRYLKCVYGKCK